MGALEQLFSQLGYEDCNDATTLRKDPVLKTCCGRDPVDGGIEMTGPNRAQHEPGVGRGGARQRARRRDVDRQQAERRRVAEERQRVLRSRVAAQLQLRVRIHARDGDDKAATPELASP